MEKLRGSLPREISALTSVRGIAALWVVAFHLSGNIWYPCFALHPAACMIRFITSGQYCVDIFFILSGYVLSHSYALNFDLRAFALKRIFRIYPLHIVVFSLTVAEFFWIYRTPLFAQNGFSTLLDVLVFYYSLTFVWLGMAAIWGTPTWSLSAELFAYCVFPFLRAGLAKTSRFGSVVMLFGLLAAQMLILARFGFGSTGWEALSRAVIGLAIGMILFRAKGWYAMPGWLTDVGALGVFMAFFTNAPELAALPIACVLFSLGEGATSMTQRLLHNTAIRWVGEVSYSVYLLHAPLIVLFQLLLPGHGFLFLHSWMFFTVFFLCLLLGASGLTYRTIEIPTRRWGRGLAVDLARQPV